jgi:hypothetical protein
MSRNADRKKSITENRIVRKKSLHYSPMMQAFLCLLCYLFNDVNLDPVSKWGIYHPNIVVKSKIGF